MVTTMNTIFNLIRVNRVTSVYIGILFMSITLDCETKVTSILYIVAPFNSKLIKQIKKIVLWFTFGNSVALHNCLVRIR